MLHTDLAAFRLTALVCVCGRGYERGQGRCESDKAYYRPFRVGMPRRYGRGRAINAGVFTRGQVAIPYSGLYSWGMTRKPNPRYIADIRLAVEVSGMSDEIAEARLEEVRAFIVERLGRSTFTRLPGQPAVVYSDIISDVVRES